MKKALEYLEIVESLDTRQQSKGRHKLKEIIGISFFAMLGNAGDPEEIDMFSREHEEFLRKYFELENGIPSHDIIERAFEIVSAEYLQGFRDKFNELMNNNEGEKVRKILALDGSKKPPKPKNTTGGFHFVGT